MTFDKGWHIDRRISVGSIVTIVTMLSGLLYYVQKTETRTQLLEQRIEVEITRSEKADKTLELLIKEYRIEGKEGRQILSADMDTQFDRVNSKLDKLMLGGK